MKSKIIKAWSRVKPALIAFIKKVLTRKVLAKLLGSSMAGGIYGWAIAYIVSLGVERVLEPSIEYLIRKGLLFVDQTSGKISMKKLEEAKRDDDKDKYIDIVTKV